MAEHYFDRWDDAICCGITEKREVSRWRVKGLMDIGGGYGPHMMLGCLFVLSAVIGLFISNTATAVLMAPIALAAAKTMGCRLIHLRWCRGDVSIRRRLYDTDIFTC